MANNQCEENSRTITELIGAFCNVILTQRDSLSKDDGLDFINSLTDSEIRILNLTEQDSVDVVWAIEENVRIYINKYQVSDCSKKKMLGSPFEFDSRNNYLEYCNFLTEIYKQKNNGASFPKVFDKALAYIKEMSSHYRVFEQFYVIRSQETIDGILSQVEKTATKKATEAIEKGISQATSQAAKMAAEKAVAYTEARAERAMESANSAEERAETAADKAATDAANRAVDKKMHEVSAKISENSVAILGIFAGIVLAVVAGLFYSSSVLESLYNTNIFKVICVSSLVGLICVYLLALMFYYIDKLGGSKYSFDILFAKIKYISIVLISIMLISGVLYFFVPEEGSEQQNAQSDMNISGELNVSVDEKETLPLDKIKPEPQTDTTTNTETDGNIE